MASLNEDEFGSVPPAAASPERYERPMAMFGSGRATTLFGQAQVTPTPWPQAGRKKDGSHHDKELIRRTMSEPPQIESIDPRYLHSTQPSVVREHVDAYMGEPGKVYEQTGRTVRDQDSPGNQWPTVYERRDGRRDILTGHHRATKALIKGEPLKGRIIREQ